MHYAAGRIMKRQHGAALIEFALVVTFVVLVLFGLIELGRGLFTWNSAVDATRRGARTAAIVAVDDKASVLSEMQIVMPDLKAANVVLEYSIDGNFPGAACVRGTCRFVRVSVNYVFKPVVFFLPISIQLPTFATTLPVEALGAG